MAPALPSHCGRAKSAAVLFFATAILAGRTAEAQPPPSGQLVIAVAQAQFGDRYQFETVPWTYTVTNTGTTSVRILESLALDGTGQVRALPETLAPGATARIDVSQPLADRLGAVSFRYALLTDEPGGARARFTLSGFVQSAFDPEQPRFDFGTLDRSFGGRAEAAIASREVEALRITGIEGAPPYLRITWSDPIGDGPAHMTATVMAGAPQGLLTGAVQVRTNVVHQPLIAVRYLAQVFGDVVPQEVPLRLGAIRVGESASGRMRLSSRTGRPFEVGIADDAADSVRPANAPGRPTVAFRTCDGTSPPSACHEVEMSLAPITTGPIAGVVEVRIAGQVDPLPILYTALAIRPDAVIRQLEIPSPPTATPGMEDKP